MADTKISAFPVAAVDSSTQLLGCNTSGGGSTTDQLFDVASLAAYLASVGQYPRRVSYQRKTGQIAATSLTPYTVGATDESLQLSVNVLLTIATVCAFKVLCTYNDENNTARTLTLYFADTVGDWTDTVKAVDGVTAYCAGVLHLKAKAGTTVTISTVGTFTTCQYNFEQVINLMNS